MMHRLSILSLATFALLGAIAGDIETTSWGIMLDNPEHLPSSVPANRTPGSDIFYLAPQHRLISPAYYAALDAYDTRAVASTGLARPNLREDAYHRLIHFINTNSTANTASVTNYYSFLNRAKNLRYGRLSPYFARDKFAYWTCPEVLALTNAVSAPAYADFSWTTDPRTKLFGSWTSSGWPCAICPALSQLDSSDLFPMRPAGSSSPLGINPFLKMLGTRGFGRECHVEDPTLAETLQHGECRALPATFENVLAQCFTNVTANAITNTSQRLLLPVLAVVDQTIALCSSSYHIAETPTFVKTTKGRGLVRFESSGTLYGTFTFDLASGEVSANVSNYSFQSPTPATNAVETWEASNLIPSPAASFVRIGSAQSQDSVTADPGSNELNAFAPWDTLRDFLDPYFADPSVTYLDIDYYCVADEAGEGNSCGVYVKTPARTSPTFIANVTQFYGYPVTLTEMPIHAMLECWYPFDYGPRPSSMTCESFPNDYFDDYASNYDWYLFSSFISEDGFAPNDQQTLRDAAYGRTKDAYGYQCHRRSGSSKTQFQERITDELNVLEAKREQSMGTVYRTNAQNYMGVTLDHAAQHFANPVTWNFGVETAPAGAGGNWIRARIVRANDPYVSYQGADGSWGFNAATRRPSVGGSFNLVGESSSSISLPGPKNFEAYLGVLTKTDWNFPQLKRSNN